MIFIVPFFCLQLLLPSNRTSISRVPRQLPECILSESLFADFALYQQEKDLARFVDHVITGALLEGCLPIGALTSAELQALLLEKSEGLLIYVHRIQADIHRVRNVNIAGDVLSPVASTAVVQTETAAQRMQRKREKTRAMQQGCSHPTPLENALRLETGTTGHPRVSSAVASTKGAATLTELIQNFPHGLSGILVQYLQRLASEMADKNDKFVGFFIDSLRVLVALGSTISETALVVLLEVMWGEASYDFANEVHYFIPQLMPPMQECLRTSPPSMVLNSRVTFFLSAIFASEPGEGVAWEGCVLDHILQKFLGDPGYGRQGGVAAGSKAPLIDPLLYDSPGQLLDKGMDMLCKAVKHSVDLNNVCEVDIFGANTCEKVDIDEKAVVWVQIVATVGESVNLLGVIRLIRAGFSVASRPLVQCNVAYWGLMAGASCCASPIDVQCWLELFKEWAWCLHREKDDVHFSVLSHVFGKGVKKIFQYMSLSLAGKSFQELWTFVKGQHLPLDVCASTIALGCFVKLNDLLSVIALFAEMKRDPALTPTAITYNTVINAYA